MSERERKSEKKCLSVLMDDKEFCFENVIKLIYNISLLVVNYEVVDQRMVNDLKRYCSSRKTPENFRQNLNPYVVFLANLKGLVGQYRVSVTGHFVWRPTDTQPLVRPPLRREHRGGVDFCLQLRRERSSRPPFTYQLKY